MLKLFTRDFKVLLTNAVSWLSLLEFSSSALAAHRPDFQTNVSSAGANIHYYVAIYSQDDGRLNLPRNAHSYGAFIAYDYDRREVVERFAINWLPADDKVALLSGPKPGKNFPLWQTQNFGHQRGFLIHRWGPHEVQLQLYYAARQQWLRLERASIDKSVLYVAIDPNTRRNPFHPALNCIHALAGILGDLNFGLAHGASASGIIDQFFSPYYLSWESPNEIQLAFSNFELGS